MATRYPLIIDSTTNNKIKELPSGDDLNLSGSSIVNVINATASGTVTANAVEVTSNTFSVAGNSLNQVAFTGNYNDLSNAPTVFNGNYDNLTNKPTLKTTIESLDNVSTTAPADNQVLQYDSSSSTYKPSSIVSVSSSSIDALLDVNVSNIASAAGQILKWDGSAWIRGNASSGSDADTLDSYEGTYYLNANNFTNYKVITSVAGDTGSFTTSTSSDTVNIQGGTGISTAITSNTLTITNDSPDQTVAFTDGTNITVTGTYPNFTIATDAVTATLNTISVASNSSPSGSGSIAFNQSSGAITFTPPDLSSYLTSVGVLSSHTDVDTTAPTSGQVLKWNGTAWAPAADGGGGGGGGSGDIEAVTAGTGLTGGGTVGSVTLNVDVGTTANKIVQIDSTGKLPAIDGSQLTNVSGGGGGTQNLFSTIAVSGQNNVVADATTDTLTFVAGTNISITTDAANDTITFASSGGGGTQNVFNAIAVAGQNSVVADTTTDILTLAEGGGIDITTNDTTDTVTLAAYLHSTTAGSVDKLDSIAFIDADDNSTKKATITSLLTEIAGTNLAVSGNQLNATVGLTNIVEDTTPQLGGNLDMNGKQIQYTFNITASGVDHYVFNDGGNVFFASGGVNDPTLYLKRGEIYVFNNTSGGHPLRIQSTPGVSGTAYNTGVTNNGNTGAVTFKVPNDAPHQLYYQCTSHGNMRGVIYIDAVNLDSVSQSAITTGSDSIVFIDSSDENKTKKEPISDFLTDIAGTGITVTSDQLTAADTFVALTDTPANFTSAGGKIVKVNSGASALEFADNNIVSQLNSYVTVTDTGTDGTVTLHTDGTDRWKITSSGHIIPQADSSYDIGSASNKIRHIFISDNSIKFGAAELPMTVTASRLHFNSAKLMVDVIDDATPQLGGDLDVSTFDLVSTTNRNIDILPHGTGKVNIDGDGSAGGVSVSDGLIEVRTGTGSVGAIDFFCEVNNAHKVTLKAPAHSNYSGNVNFTLPASEGTSGELLRTDGAGNTSWVTVVAGDATLAGQQTFSGDKTFSGKVIGSITDNSATGSFDLNNGNNFKLTPTGATTIDFTNMTAGQSGNIYLDNSGGHTISKDSTIKMLASQLNTISNTGVYWLSYYCIDGTNVVLTASGKLT